jgi:DNA-binding CsgD family transcriptional regulator
MSYSLETAASLFNATGLADPCKRPSTDRQVEPASRAPVSEPAPDWFVPKIWQLCLDWMARDLGATGAGLLFLGLPPQALSHNGGGKAGARANGPENTKVWATVGDATLPRQLWLHDHGSRPAWATCMRRIAVGQWLACETLHGLIGDAIQPEDSCAPVVGAKLAHGASMVVYAGFQSRPGQAAALAKRALLGGAALAAAAQSLVRVRDQGQETQWARESRHTQIAHLVKMHSLTEAESHILHQLVSGTPCRDIARKRTVMLSTVKSQIKSIYSKLGVHRAGQIYGLL